MTGSLYLFPTDPRNTPPDVQPVVAVLEALQLIGQPYRSGRWLAGDGLLRYITFAGCSPHLEFTPPTDGSDDFCHVALLGPFSEPRLYTGNNTLNPRCPACKTRVADWRPLAAAYAHEPLRDWQCPSCNTEQGIETLRWRHHAAFGRLLVEVHRVFPAEGVPSDELLAALERGTRVAWDYGWAASSR
jgi:hypothetical protein